MMSRKEVFRWPELAVDVFSRPTRVVMVLFEAERRSPSLTKKAIFVCWIAGRESGHRAEPSNWIKTFAGLDIREQCKEAYRSCGSAGDMERILRGMPSSWYSSVTKD